MWQEWFEGNDKNSIRSQILNMIWDSAVFQSINECREYAPKNDKGETELNGVVHRFIDKCFFETQSLAIRRLLDRRDDVISLCRLVEDMEKHCYLLTRKNILDAHGYPYEYEQEKKRIKEEAYRNAPSGPIVISNQSYFICFESERVHNIIDFLSDVESAKRSPDDCVRPKIFEWLKQRISRCDEIKTFVNKFLAHSATSESRSYLKPTELDVTLGQILEAHKIICENADFIGLNILCTGFGDFLAAPQFDQFVYFDKAWATEKTIKKLREFWSNYNMQTMNWNNWNWKDEFNKFLH